MASFCASCSACWLFLRNIAARVDCALPLITAFAAWVDCALLLFAASAVAPSSLSFHSATSAGSPAAARLCASKRFIKSSSPESVLRGGCLETLLSAVDSSGFNLRNASSKVSGVIPTFVFGTAAIFASASSFRCAAVAASASACFWFVACAAAAASSSALAFVLISK